MADTVATSVAKGLSDVSIGTMVAALGQAIAAAQQTLDMNSLKVAQMLTGSYQDDKGNTQSSLVTFDGEKLSLMELGFTPTFYQFVETTIEVKVSITMSTSQENSGFEGHFGSDSSATGKGDAFYGMGASGSADNAGAAGKAGWQPSASGSGSASINAALVGAAYSSKFQYSAEGSSSVRVRLVPIPPPAILEERIRRSLDKKAAARQAG